MRQTYGYKIHEVMDEELVIIGKVLRTHGLAGALKVAPLTDIPNRFQRLKSVILETPSGMRKSCTLERVAGNKEAVVLSCREITSVEEASLFVHGWVKVRRSESPPLPSHQFYHADLIGMAVFFEDGGCLGILEEIVETGSNDIFVVRQGPKEHLIPAIQDVVREVDVEKKRMVLRRMEGLVDEDAV